MDTHGCLADTHGCIIRTLTHAISCSYCKCFVLKYEQICYSSFFGNPCLKMSECEISECLVPARCSYWLFICSRPQWLVWIRRSWLFVYAPQALWASSVTLESHWSEANVWDSFCQWSIETWSKSLIYTDTQHASDTRHYKCIPLTTSHSPEINTQMFYQRVICFLFKFKFFICFWKASFQSTRTHRADSSTLVNL